MDKASQIKALVDELVADIGTSREKWAGELCAIAKERDELRAQRDKAVNFNGQVEAERIKAQQEIQKLTEERDEIRALLRWLR